MTWFWIGLFFSLVLLVVLLVWLFNRIHQDELILERQATRDQPQTTQLPIRTFEGTILDRMVLFTTARNMRRRVPVLSNELDIPQTLAASLERGGWFTPVYRYRQVMPEYLILVDRTSHRDHQAQFVEHMLADFKDNAVYTQVYLFDGDPRICFHAEGKEPPCTLEDLTHRYADHRLILFSDGSGLFSPMTGEQEAWTMLFETWSERTMMTPVFVDQWGYQEQVLQNEFVLLPATAEGLSRLTDAFYQGDTSALAAGQPTAGAMLPDELRMRPLYWTSRNPPDEEQITRMLTKLRRYLNDEASYFWLQACAIYPQLDWNLTLYLGEHLRDKQNEQLLSPQRLIALSRLPWFRQGYIPDWLRTELITTMTPAQETQVRECIYKLFKSGEKSSDAGDSDGDVTLEFAQQHPQTIVAWAKRNLRRLAKQAPEDSPIKDYIFLRFMYRKKLQPLWVRLPAELRERFPKQQPRLLIAAGAAAVVVLALVTAWAMVWKTPTNPLFPVTLDEWRNETRTLSQDFTREGDHYWRFVPTNTYTIGGWLDDDDEDNDAQANIALPDYWIGKHPITRQQYLQFKEAGGYDNETYWTPNGWAWKEAYNNGEGRLHPYYWDDARFGDDNQPVVGVTWYEATAYANWLNEQLAGTLPTGYRVQLPTEAAWEVACAYGADGQRHPYPWGEQLPDATLADFGKDWQSDKPAPVGDYPDGAAANGAQEMVGSVWEVMSNSYKGYAAQSGDVVADFSTGDWDVPYRSGSWGNQVDITRCAVRGRVIADSDFGFRLVLSP
jgi:formylglycine-generating enzyme required for sulfatase activity